MRKLYFTLSFVILLNLLPLNGVFAEEVFEGFNLTFDTFDLSKPEDAGIDEAAGNLYSDESPEKGKVLSISGKGGMRFYKKLKTDASEGAYRLSFDFKKTENEGLTYIRLTNKAYNGYNMENANNMFQAYAARSTDQGFYMGTTGWTVDSSVVSFSANKWYSVDMWIDMDDKNAYYYSNGEFIGKTTVSDAMTEISGVIFVAESGTNTNIVSVDNFSFEKIDIEAARQLKKEGGIIPDELTQSVSAEITSNEIGHIFGNHIQPSLDVKLKNREKHSVEAKVEYTVLDGYMKNVWSKKTDVKLNEGESVTQNVNPSLNRYDIYILEVSVTIDGYTDTFRKEFSYCNLPSPDYVNDEYGICSHTNKWGKTELDKGMPVIQKMGISIDREDFGWSSYETEPGVYWGNAENKAKFEKWLAYLEEAGIKPLILWWPENPYVGVPSGSRVPRTEEGLRALENAAYNFALTYGDRCPYYEFSNELNGDTAESLPAEDFVNALKAFYTGIKRGNPNAIVLGHAIGGVDVAWGENMLLAGGAQYCDAVGVHPYPRAPEGDFDFELQEMRDMLDSHGWQHIKIWITETVTASSWTSNSVMQQAYYMIRDFLLYEKTKLADKIIVYQLQTPGVNIRDDEDWFGMINGYTVENAYGAKPAFLYLTNYLTHTEDAVFEEAIQDGDVYVYRWKKNDGTYLYFMYAYESMIDVTMNFGTETAVMKDGYGNETQLFGIDGRYSLTLTADPIYFETASPTFTLETSAVGVEKRDDELTVGDSTEFTFIAPIGCEVVCEAKDNFEVVRNGNTYSVTLKEKSEVFDFTARNDWKARDLNRDYIKLNIMKDGKLNGRVLVGFDFVEKQVDADLEVRPYNDEDEEHWVGEYIIKNNRTERNVSGTITLKNPTDLIKYVRPVRVENLAPGATFRSTFNIPYEFIKADNYYEAEFVSDDGEVSDFFLGICSRSNRWVVPAWKKKTVVLRKADGETIIDGNVTDEEWADYSYGKFDKDEGFSGEFFAKWDEKNLYVAARIKDDVHDQKQVASSIRFGDVLFVSAKPTSVQRHETQMSIGMTEVPQAANPVCRVDWSQMNDREFKLYEKESSAKVVRDGDMTYYEAVLPWNIFLRENVKKHTNMHLRLDIQDRDGDKMQNYEVAQWVCLTNNKNGR